MAVSNYDDDQFLTDDEKEKIALLLPSIKMISRNIDCECVLCGELLLFHWKLPCQHIFCHNCHQQFMINSSYSYCCFHDFYYPSYKLIRDVHLEKAVSNIRVFCLHRDIGCSSVLTLKSFLQHECPVLSQRIKKSFPTKEEFKTKFEDFFIQMDVTNTFVPKVVEEDKVEGIDPDGNQFSSCLKKLQEESESPKTEVLGLQKINQQVIKDKVDSGPVVHFQSASQESFIQVSRKVKETVFNWTVTDWSQKLQLPFILSEFFTVVGAPACSMQMKLQIKDGLLWAWLLFQHENNKVVSAVKYHRRTLTIRHHNKAKKHIQRLEEASFGSSGLCVDQPMPFQPIPLDLISQGEYVRDDCVEMKLQLDPVSILFKTMDKSCRLSKQRMSYKWVIDNVREKVADQMAGVSSCVCRSGYLASTSNGYRMQLTLLLQDRSFTLCLDFLIGEWDAKLPTVFPHQLRVFVLGNEKKKQYLIGQCEDEDGYLFGDRIEKCIGLEQLDNLLVNNRTLHLLVEVEKF